MVTIAGKTDPTLVKMATAAEMADKPVSMQAEFKGITDTFTTYMTGIGALYAKEKAEIEAKMKPFEDIFKSIEKEYSDGTYTNEEVDSYRDQLIYYRNLLKKSGPRERDKIMSRVNKFYNSISAGNGENLKFVKLINAGMHDGESMGQSYTTEAGVTLEAGETLELFTKLGEKNYMLSWENDEKNYTVTIGGKDVKLSHSELGKIFKEKEAGAVEAYEAIVASQEAFAKSADGKWDFDAVKNQVNQNLFINERWFEFSVNNVMGNNPMSYRDALHSPNKLTEQMWTSLNDLSDPNFIAMFDSTAAGGDGDGKLEASDFTEPGNWKKLVSALTTPGAEGFNKKVAYSVASGWFAEQVQTDYDASSKDKPGEWGTQFYVNQRITNVIEGFQEGNLDLMNQTGKSGIRFEDDNGTIKVFINYEEYTLNTEHVGSFNPTNNDEVSLYDIVSQLGLGNDPVFQQKFMNTDWDSYEWGGEAPEAQGGPSGTGSPTKLTWLATGKEDLHNFYLAFGLTPAGLTKGQEFTLNKVSNQSPEAIIDNLKKHFDNFEIFDLTGSANEKLVVQATDSKGNKIKDKVFELDLSNTANISASNAEALQKFAFEHFQTQKKTEEKFEITVPKNYGLETWPSGKKAQQNALHFDVFTGLFDVEDMGQFVKNLPEYFTFDIAGDPPGNITFEIEKSQGGLYEYVRVLKNGQELFGEPLKPMVQNKRWKRWQKFLQMTGAKPKIK